MYSSVAPCLVFDAHTTTFCPGFLYHPELIANTLESYLRQSKVKGVKYLQYFLDTEYRENPKDYAPTEILYQFILENNRPPTAS